LKKEKKRLIAQILKKHDRVKWIPDAHSAAWDSGTYAHRPVISVRTETELVAFLQRKPDAQGVSVKDLKDGWPDCEEAINKLEKENKILVTRTKKDNHARMIWGNDPSLVHRVDTEFVSMWRHTELPSVDELVKRLREAGQKPASEDPSKRIKPPPKMKEKKKKALRKGVRSTNRHIDPSILKDYGHFK